MSQNQSRRSLLDDLPPAAVPQPARAASVANVPSVKLTVRESARRHLQSLGAGNCLLFLWGVDSVTGTGGWTVITLPAAKLRERLLSPFVSRLEDVALVIPDCDRAHIETLDGRALDYCRGALMLE